MSDPRHLRQAHDAVRSAARELCEPQQHAVHRDNGKPTIHEAASLLDLLRDAVSNGATNGRKRASRSPELISLRAFDLLQQITADAAELARNADPSTNGATVEDHIRVVARAAGQWTDPYPVRAAAHHLQGFADEIRTLLDPPRRYEITAACPACDTRMVWRHQDGEDVQVPALTVDGHRGCVCLACDHVWPPAQLAHLALVIGCDPIGEHADSDPAGHGP